MRSNKRRVPEVKKVEVITDINEIIREIKTAPVSMHDDLDSLVMQLKSLHGDALRLSADDPVKKAGLAVYNAGCKAVHELVRNPNKKEYNELKKAIIDAGLAIKYKNTEKVTEKVKDLYADATQISRRLPWKRLKQFASFFKGTQQKTQGPGLAKALRDLAGASLDTKTNMRVLVQSLIASNPLDIALADEIFQTTIKNKELRTFVINDIVPTLNNDDLFKLTHAIMESHKRLEIQQFYPLRASVLSSDLYLLYTKKIDYSSQTTESAQMTVLNLCVYDMMVEKQKLDKSSVSNPLDAAVDGINFKIQSEKINSLTDVLKNDGQTNAFKARVRNSIEQAVAEREKPHGEERHAPRA